MTGLRPLAASLALAAPVAWDDAGDPDDLDGLSVVIEAAREALTASPVVPYPAPCKAPLRAPKGRSGEAFYDGLILAKRAAIAALGEAWWRVPGASVWADCRAVRSFKTARGVTVSMTRDQRLPAARYWPSGALPRGIKLGTGKVSLNNSQQMVLTGQ